MGHLCTLNRATLGRLEGGVCPALNRASLGRLLDAENRPIGGDDAPGAGRRVRKVKLEYAGLKRFEGNLRDEKLKRLERTLKKLKKATTTRKPAAIKAAVKATHTLDIDMPTISAMMPDISHSLQSVEQVRRMREAMKVLSNAISEHKRKRQNDDAIVMLLLA